MYKKLFLFYLFSFIVWAAPTKDPAETIEKINSATINALMIFTSQDGLNSGEYTFTNTPIDINMKIYHLPFLYNFHSKTNLNYFIIGNVGYNQVSLSGDQKAIPGNQAGLNSFNNINAYTVGLGGGVRYQLLNKLYFSVGTEFIYSRMGISVKSEQPIEDAIKDFFNKNYSRNITYKLFASAEYRPTFHRFKPYVTLGHRLYETKSSFSLKDLSSFHSVSSVSYITIGAETPPLYSYTKNSFLTAETYFHGHVLDGIVKDVSKVGRYGSFGGILYWNTPNDPWWTSRFFLEAAIVVADGLHGYNIGAGFTLDF